MKIEHELFIATIMFKQNSQIVMACDARDKYEVRELCREYFSPECIEYIYVKRISVLLKIKE